jgi:tetraacyldisaccharide-1-P 4'-kinase
LEVVFRWSFPDHHAYKPSELQRVAHQARIHGADILVTTEKDRLNCPSHLERVIAPIGLAWLRIELELENESGLFSILESVLDRARPKHFAL